MTEKAEFVIGVGSGAGAATTDEIREWFLGNGFTRVEFDGPKAYVTTYSGARPVAFKLFRRESFDTFSREGYGGALVVFEVRRHGEVVEFDGYCPIWLFGIWNLKSKFKEKAGWISKYRQEGFEMRESFLKFLNGV